jgi:outer membrane usher protein FimD/PapC
LAQHQSSASAVRVFLKVTEKTDNQEEQNAIAQMSGKEHLDFLDLSLIKSVNNQEAQDIGADNTVMLTITIPYSSAGKKNISVYRYHDGEVNVLTGIPNENGEYISVGKNELVLHAMKFSTYAVGYNEKV